MVEKRVFKKMPFIKGEIAPPIFYGDSNPDAILNCWGSMYGIVREVVDELI